MELSMSMRYVRIRARQKADNGPVLAEHTMSALLMLAGSNANTVMPSGTDAVKAKITGDILQLQDAFSREYGIENTTQVMESLDKILKTANLETGAGREYAALQADAEKWMEKNPEEGDEIKPIAMFYTVIGIIDDTIIDAAMMTTGESDSAVISFDPTATVIDMPEIDPTATVIDADVSENRDAEEEAERRRREEAEAEAERRRREEAEAEAERRRNEEEEAERRRREEAEAEAERRRNEEAQAEALRQQFARQLFEEEAERKKVNRAIASKANAKAVIAFIAFAAVTFAGAVVYQLLVEKNGGEATWWMKIIFFVIYLIAYIVSIGSINKMQQNPDLSATQTTFMRMRTIGTAGMIYFRTVIATTIFPAILLLIIFLSVGEITPFWYYFFEIYLFCYIIGLITLAFQCNVAALSVGYLDYKGLKRKRGAALGILISGMLSVPALVLYLHWIFEWFPMKTWVLILIIIYLVITLIVSIVSSRINLTDMQNNLQ